VNKEIQNPDDKWETHTILLRNQKPCTCYIAAACAPLKQSMVKLALRKGSSEKPAAEPGR